MNPEAVPDGVTPDDREPVGAVPAGAGRRGALRIDAAPDGRRRGRGRGSGWQRAVVVVLALLVLAGLFVVGTRLPGILNLSMALPAPVPTTPTATPTPSPVPTSTAGPQLAGTFEWYQLRGGECIAPFTFAWQQRFTVVDCQVEHGGQVTGSAKLDADPAAVYPGQTALAEMMNLLCQKPENFSPSVLGVYPDVVRQAGYPVNDTQWQAGQRNYYCFISRSSSLPLVGSFAPPGSTG